MATVTSGGSKRLSTTAVVLGIVAIIVLTAIPVLIIKDSEFGGSDGVGSEAIAEIAPNYDSSWISNIWSPPGGETESMLFALQAIAGGLLIGYFFGYKRGFSKTQEQPHESKR